MIKDQPNIRAGAVLPNRPQTPEKQHATNQQIERQSYRPTNRQRVKESRTRDFKKDPVPSNEVWDTHCLISALSFVSRRTHRTASCGNSQAGKAHIYPEGPEANFAEVALFLSLIRFRG